ncbi:MAG: hypothetical protein Q9161_002054 [Pseudevernia consocians]
MAIANTGSLQDAESEHTVKCAFHTRMAQILIGGHSSGDFSAAVVYFYKRALDICKRSDDPEKASLHVDICLGIATIAAETNKQPSSLEHKKQALKNQLQDLEAQA